MSGVKPYVPELLTSSHAVYQEYYAGTESSDLIYRVARGVYISGAGDQTGIKVAILVSALSCGAIKGKSLPLIFSEIAATELLGRVQKWVNDNKNSEDKKVQCSVVKFVGVISYSLFCTYLLSYRNTTLSMKPYYFSIVVQPLFLTACRFNFVQQIFGSVAQIFGGEKCSNHNMTRKEMAKTILSEVAALSLSAKCATLVTGESLKMNWTAFSIFHVLRGASIMYL